MRVKGVVWDMDGILIDSEPVYQEYNYQYFVKKYPWIKKEDLNKMVGMSDPDGRAYLCMLCKKNVDDKDFQNEMTNVYTDCKVDYASIMFECIPRVLATLRQMGIKLAVASSSSPDNIRQVLDECKIRNYFDEVISGFDFSESKPNPEIYLHTFEKLGLKPEECIVVEDSPYGIEAGKASGATVVARREDRFSFDQSRADFILDSMADLPRLMCREFHQIKAAFFDVDGTLATFPEHKIMESTRVALDKLKSEGVKCILSTGRHRLEIEQENILPGLTFDGYIWMNGQLCELDNKTVLEYCISRDELIALKDFLKENHCSCIFLEKDKMYANIHDDKMAKGQEQVGTALPPIGDISNAEDKKIYQVIPFVTEETQEKLMEIMPNCEMMRWSNSAVDVIEKGGGKDKGIKAICSALGINPSETIAFGDAQNDISMLKTVGIGVAMGNSTEDVKEVADYTADDIEDDGLYNALVHFGVIE